jgi:hypothetical protein
VSDPEKGAPLDFSLRALFAPRLDHDYFALARERPFGRQGSGLDLVTAWWLAEMSLLAYVPEREFVTRRLGAAGFDRTTFFERDGTFCFVAENASDVAVVFRGTKLGDRQDLKTDLTILLAGAAGGGRVHTGFQGALDHVWPELSSHLDRALGERALFLTGHSLGAALATVAAARFPRARALYTFGSPRVGDATFTASITIPAYRFVNNSDLVAELPPPIGYQHVGELRFFDREGKLLAEPPLWQRLSDGLAGHGARFVEVAQRWLHGELDQVAISSLIDHAPLHYALLLRASAM